MKFAVLLLAVCLSCVSSGQVKEQVWGKVNGKILGMQNVFVESSMFQIKKHTFVFPKVRIEISGPF